MMKLAKFGLTIPIFESETEQQLLHDLVKTMKLAKFGLTIPIFKSQQNNNYHKTAKTMKLVKFVLSISIFESQTEQLLRDFKEDEITELRTVHTHF